jgi:glycopeptide antibiotics resistance protein
MIFFHQRHMANLSDLNHKLRVPLALIYTIGVVIALLTPGNALPKVPLFPNADKLVHLSLFAGFAFVWMRTKVILLNQKYHLIPLGISFILPILLEYMQLFVPNRTFDYLDMVANLAGALFGFIGFIILYKAQSKLV